jgi:Uma2 family endonuclease
VDLLTKGHTMMTLIPESLPITTPANNVLGPEQGHWTYDDYASIPDDGKRYQVVKGVLFMSPAPNRWHQQTVGRIFRYLSTHIEDTGMGKVYIAPFDVELAPKTVVQPDVLVVLNPHLERISDQKIIGAPDLVAEITSPGTAGFDRRQKQDAYAIAGVPEYWIVDPASHTTELLVLENGSYRSLGIFQGQHTLPSTVVPNFPVPVEQFFV